LTGSASFRQEFHDESLSVLVADEHLELDADREVGREADEHDRLRSEECVRRKSNDDKPGCPGSSSFRRILRID